MASSLGCTGEFGASSGAYVVTQRVGGGPSLAPPIGSGGLCLLAHAGKGPQLSN
jgi:hypothetical protein